MMEAVEQSSTAVVEPPVAPVAAKPAADTREKRKQQPRHHVVLWNDEDHTYEYVIEMLQKLFAHPAEKGFQLAKEV
ncbi:MAG: ATP-dependent Clp protease adaptor ClpS, partial [Planctomycetota bacterium]